MKNTAKVVLVCLMLSMISSFAGAAKSKKYQSFVFNKKTKIIKVYPKTSSFWEYAKDLFFLICIGVSGGICSKVSYKRGDKYIPYVLGGGTLSFSLFFLRRIVEKLNNYRNRFEPVVVVNKQGIAVRSWVFFGYRKEPNKIMLGLTTFFVEAMPWEIIVKISKNSDESITISDENKWEINIRNGDTGISIKRLYYLIKCFERKMYYEMLCKINEGEGYESKK